MKLTVISDTHGHHAKLGRLSGDVLIHCGDMFNMFSQNYDECEEIDEWFGEQDFDLVLCIGGNHDFELQERSYYVEEPFKNAVYLEATAFEFEGIRFFGAPWVPDLRGQAFFVEDDELPGKWSEIPTDVDVLITHTPPAGILDVSSRGLKLGCHHLLSALEDARPSVHCFGHVHASSGIHSTGATNCINAALVNSHYQLQHPPYELEL